MIYKFLRMHNARRHISRTLMHVEKRNSQFHVGCNDLCNVTRRRNLDAKSGTIARCGAHVRYLNAMGSQIISLWVTHSSKVAMVVAWRLFSVRMSCIFRFWLSGSTSWLFSVARCSHIFHVRAEGFLLSPLPSPQASFKPMQADCA